MNQNGVCRAAPGFARVFQRNYGRKLNGRPTRWEIMSKTYLSMYILTKQSMAGFHWRSFSTFCKIGHGNVFDWSPSMNDSYIFKISLIRFRIILKCWTPSWKVQFLFNALNIQRSWSARKLLHRIQCHLPNGLPSEIGPENSMRDDDDDDEVYIDSDSKDW